MDYILSVNKIVLDTINSKVSVSAITDYNNPYSKQAYITLSQRNKMENFFFAFELNNIDIESIKTNIPNNDYIVILSIPETENIFKMMYYDFSDLIYYYDCASESELQEHGYKTIDTIINNCMHGKINSDKALIQVNFEVMQKEWIKNVYSYDDFIRNK